MKAVIKTKPEVGIEIKEVPKLEADLKLEVEEENA